MRKSCSVLVSAFLVLGLCSTVAWAHPRACCFPDGTCVDEYEYPCFDIGGLPRAEGVMCADVECPVEELICRVTGGGVDSTGEWDGSMGRGRDDVDRYTFGGQAGARTANQPQPWGEWTHHQQRGPNGRFVFHAGTASAPPETEIDLIECSDPGFCNPARPAPNKQIDFEGVGAFKNIRKAPAILGGVVAGVTLHWFEVHIEDLGEPGRAGTQDPPAAQCPPDGSAGAVGDCECPDFYSITIHEDADPASPVIYHVHGYITGGNLQIHPAIN